MPDRKFDVLIEVNVRVVVHDWDRFYERAVEYGSTTPTEAAARFAQQALDSDRRTTESLDGWADLEGVAEIYGPDVRGMVDSWETT